MIIKTCQNCDFEECCTHKPAGDGPACDEWRPDLDTRRQLHTFCNPDIMDRIRQISEHYSQGNQRNKAVEEIMELYEELEHKANPKWGDHVGLRDNTWSEIADVIIMCIQLAFQHDKMDKVCEIMEFKVNRQLARIEEETRTYEEDA